MTFRKRIKEISQEANRPQIHRGRLAEAYDGIGQYVLVSLAQGSSSGGFKARIASGDFGARQLFPAGTPVTVSVHRGRLEVMSLGNKSQGGGGATTGFIETLEAVINGNGSVFATGVAGAHIQQWPGSIQGWAASADQAGSLQVDLWVAHPSDHHPPTNSDSITGSDPIVIASDDYAEDTSPTGWSPDLIEGDVVFFNVDSVSTIERVTIALQVLRTI